MINLILYCRDPFAPMRAPWFAFALFDYVAGRSFDVLFDMAVGQQKVTITAEDTGGMVLANGESIPIDDWEDVSSNTLRLQQVTKKRMQSVAVAEGLLRLRPLLERIGSGEGVPEWLPGSL